MWEMKLVPDVISYKAGISAREYRVQWQRASALLGGVLGVKFSPDATSNSAVISTASRDRLPDFPLCPPPTDHYLA